MSLKSITCIYFVVIILFISSCTKPEAPHFQGITNLEVQSVSSNNIDMAAHAAFFNPNAFGGYLEATLLDIYINDQKVSQVEQTLEIDILGDSDFSVPLSFSISPKEIWGDGQGLLNLGLNLFTDKKVKINFTGTITSRLAGVSFDIPIDHTEMVSLNQSD